MFNRTSHSEPAPLADRARADAQRLTPGFSEALHSRVMRSVSQARVASLRIDQSALRSAAGYWLLPVAMAAVVALIVVPVMMLNSAPPSATVHPIVIKKQIHVNEMPEKPQLALYATAHDVNARVADVVQTTMAEQKFAGLDHDVRAATQYLVDQVPLRSAWKDAGER